MYQTSLTPIFGIAVTPASHTRPSRLFTHPPASHLRFDPSSNGTRENGTDDEDEKTQSPSPLKKRRDDHGQYKLPKRHDDSGPSGGSGGGSFSSGFQGLARSVVSVPPRNTRSHQPQRGNVGRQRAREFVNHCVLQTAIDDMARPIVCFTLRTTHLPTIETESRPTEDADTDVEEATPKRKHGFDREIQVVKDYVAVAVNNSPEVRAATFLEEAVSGYSSPAHDDTEIFFNFSGDESETVISKTVPVSPSSARTTLTRQESYPGLMEMRAEFKSTHTSHTSGLPWLDLSSLMLIPPLSLPSGTPPMFLTVIDKVVCFLTFLPRPVGMKAEKPHLSEASAKLAPGHGNVTLGWLANQIPVLRRMDNNAIDVSCILLAGGLLNERERDSALVLELQKFRIRKKKGLMGTWVPLQRARDYARSYVLESKLGTFLSDSLLKSCFGIQDEEGLPVEIKTLLAKKGLRAASAPPLSAPGSPLLRAKTPVPASPLVRPAKDDQVVSRLQALVGAGGPLRPSSPLAREVRAVVRSLSPGLEDAPGLKPALHLLNATLTSIATGMSTRPSVKFVTRKEEKRSEECEETQPPSAVVTEKFMIHLAGDTQFIQHDEESPQRRSRKRSITTIERTEELLSPMTAHQNMMELEKLLDAGAYLEVEVTRRVDQVDTVALGYSSEEKPAKVTRSSNRSASPPRTRRKGNKGRRVAQEVVFRPPMAFFTAGPSVRHVSPAPAVKIDLVDSVEKSLEKSVEVLVEKKQESIEKVEDEDEEIDIMS
jgi:hypothetical protein